MELMNFRIYLLLPWLLICTACASSQVKGEPPFVGISSMNAQGNSLASTFDIHNINDVKLDIDGIDIQIQAGEVELIHYVKKFTLSVDPNTTEEVSLLETPDDPARQLLEELESGEVDSLPFALKGRVHTTSDGDLSFKNEGHLYPVPGKPGQFRSASSRPRERR